MKSSSARQPSVKILDNLIICSGRVLITDDTKIIGYLPKNFRPDKRLIFTRLKGIRLDIFPNGALKAINQNFIKGELSLDGISFTKETGNQIDYSIKRGCRFVRIILPRKDYLNISEVQVFDITGKNVALGKTAQQSSYYGGKSGNSRINPLNAIDGNTYGSYSNGANISHTGYGSNQYWIVDLGESYKVTKVRVFNRTDKCCDQRIAGAKIQLLDENKKEILSKTWDPSDFMKEKNYRIEKNIDYPGYDINREGSEHDNIQDCAKECIENPNCRSFTYIKSGDRSGKCFLKNKFRPNRRRNLITDSGYIYEEKIYPKSKTFTFPISDDGRISTGWKNYEGPYRNGSYRIVNNRVYLSGLIKYYGDETYSLPSVIGQIPKNYCPKNTYLYTVSNNKGTASIEVNNDGIIKIIEAEKKTGTGRIRNWISLDSISWNLKNNNVDLALENKWKNLGSSIDSHIMNGNVLNINYFKGNGINSGYSLGNKDKFKISGNQTISMHINAVRNSRQNIISKAYGGEGTITLETNGSLSYYGSSGYNSSPYQGFNSKKYRME